MKSLNKLFLLITSILISSCTSNDITENLTEGINQIRFTASDFKYTNNSRTAFTISNNGAEFKWAENDTVGIFPNTGSQVYFPMQSGAGTKTATFDGGGWALKSSSTYAAYYPFKGDMYLDKTIIPVSYVGQKQVGNNSTEHLGAYDYMAAVASTPENGNVNFDFKHLGCLVQLNINIPKTTELTSLTLKAEEEIFIKKGLINLNSSEIEITPIEKTNTLSIELENISSDDFNSTIYFMINPTNIKSEKLEVQLKDSNMEIYTGEINGLSSLEKGKAYRWQVSLTSPYDLSVQVNTPGTLYSIIGDNLTKIQSLKVSGNLNSDDIRCLRQMARGVYYTYARDNIVEFLQPTGILKTLDLTDANFVKGGDYYLKIKNSVVGEDDFIFTLFNKYDTNMMFSLSNIENVFWSNKVDTISGDFSNSQLKSIVIPENVTCLKSGTFSPCTKLKTISIPKSVTHLGRIFDGDHIETIYMHPTNPPILIEKGIFADEPNDKDKIKIYVPKESIEKYKNAERWIYIKDYIYPMP